MQRVATPDVPATSHPIPLTGGMRPDEVGQTLTTEQALAGAPDHDGSRFRVTAILGASRGKTRPAMKRHFWSRPIDTP